MDLGLKLYYNMVTLTHFSIEETCSVGVLFAEHSVPWGELKGTLHFMLLGVDGMSLKKKMAIALILLCLTGLSSIQCINSQLTNNIFISPDGSVSGTTQIQRNGNRYTLTGNIYDQVLVVECNNIVVNGGGFTLQGAGGWGTAGVAGKESSAAINLSCSDVTIQNFKITGWEIGIYGAYNNNTVASNFISETQSCIAIYADNYNVVGNFLAKSISGVLDKGNNDVFKRNWIINDWQAFLIFDTTGHIITVNRIENNTEAINTSYGEGLEIYCNNFIDNQMNMATSNDAISLPIFGNGGSLPSWDNGEKGNYWNDYNGMDANQDGVGDSLYVVRTVPYTIDRYPLITPFDIAEPSINSTPAISSSISPIPISNSNTNPTTGTQPTNNPNQQTMLLVVTAALAAYLAVIVSIATFRNKKSK